MKILFAISNENISATIKKQYQNNYKGMLVTKNVYYFNAIIKELQNDKTYDVVIISEDLEPFANNNYDAIDKFLVGKLQDIREESKKVDGTNIPIIFIMQDRHRAGDNLLCRLYDIQIYNALFGEERSIEKACELIAKPRDKERAKVDYKIVNEAKQEETDDNVKEVEIKNIIAHYKKLGKSEEKYVESFDNIASQYSDAQLKVIIRFLPLNVKAVLEEQSPKYQELMTFSQNTRKPSSINSYPRKEIGNVREKEIELKPKTDVLLEQLSDIKSDEQIIIPKPLSTRPTEKVGRGRPRIKPIEPVVEEKDETSDVIESTILPGFDDLEEDNSGEEEVVVNNEPVFEPVQEIAQPVKRGRGRPKKVKTPEEEAEAVMPKAPKKRGRPKKIQPVEETVLNTPQESAKDDSIMNLFDLAEHEEEQPSVVGENNGGNDEWMLPGFDDEENQEENTDISMMGKNDINRPQPQRTFNEPADRRMTKIDKSEYSYENIENLISRDKKIVSFIGTSKNGTSFIVNNVAQVLSEMGINTAILDMTKNNNSYYIYTQNDENLRQRAHTSMEKLLSGVVEGIVVNKNLTVFTATPTDSRVYEEADVILKNLIQNYSLILIDCDYDTPYGYFDNSQEIYLVQSMDILTIQPLTAFLRDLKTRDILRQEKIRVIINKAEKVKGLNEKVIVGGLAYYNDPSMSFMTELFDKDHVPTCVIPFDLQVYTKYLGTLVDCEVSISGYPKQFVNKLKSLANMIYPLVSGGMKPNYAPPSLNRFGSMPMGQNNFR